MRQSDSRTIGLGMLYGAMLGTAIVAVLAVLALQLNPPGGVGEARTWFGLYAIVSSLPTSLALEWLWPTVQARGLAIVVVIHWILLGGAAGFGIVWRRRRSRPST